MIEGKKYLLVCFWKMITKVTANKNNSSGILFPDNTIAIKNIINKKGEVNFKYFKYFSE